MAVLPAPQLSFDELGTPLREVTFVVLDLETTGGSAVADSITEVGAVKVRGGEQLGELATLVGPAVDAGRPPATFGDSAAESPHPLGGRHTASGGREPGGGPRGHAGVPLIRPGIVALTGITPAMLVGAPPPAAVLPSVLEFLTGAVLVAHNAPFDVGFLRAACRRHGYPWPHPPVLCTARLARAVLSHAEAPSVRLGALAELFGTTTRPVHRALADARATVEVLHHLLMRIGNLGVQSLEELLALTRDSARHRPTQRVRSRRHLADGLPSAPGVYLFRGARGEVLYVGTSGDVRRRVRSYFTAGERRRRMRDMVSLAERVEAVVCAHALEAAVRELRLIAAHRPRYNRRSRNPGAAWWVAPTVEPFPRLSVISTARDGALGPFPHRRGAAAAVETLLDAVALRPCTLRIPARNATATPCALHELGRCAAPCAGRQSVSEYAPAVDALDALVSGRDDAPLHVLAAEVDALGARERFEAAAQRRDGLAALVTTLERAQQLAALAALPELVGARPDGAGGWEIAIVRYGQLATAGVARRGVAPMPVIDALRLGAQVVLAGEGPLRGAPAEEVRLLHRWLTGGGTRLVHSERAWAEPARGAAPWGAWVQRARPLMDDGADGVAVTRSAAQRPGRLRGTR